MSLKSTQHLDTIVKYGRFVYIKWKKKITVAHREKRNTMLKRLSTLILCSVTLLHFTEAQSAAPVTYRFKDDSGATVLGITVPPEFVKNGYEVLNQSGMVIQVIPPAPTADEKAERERQQQIEATQLAQREKDRELLRLYSHPDEIILLWQRRVDDINSFIKQKNDNIDLQRKKLDVFLSQAADLQRSGKTVDDSLVSNMSIIEDKIQALQNEIEKNKRELAEENLGFEAKMKRLIELTGKSPTKPIPISSN